MDLRDVLLDKGKTEVLRQGNKPSTKRSKSFGHYYPVHEEYSVVRLDEKTKGESETF